MDRNVLMLEKFLKESESYRKNGNKFNFENANEN
jgi:hypothetical protein